jgi:pimeloyl-ACP methyl ester carboxylesterase
MQIEPRLIHPLRIIFFTGLGCDERMVAPHRAIDAEIDFVPWIEPLKDESLAEYSARLAERIDFSKPFYLAGISLGGMVAQEIARQIARRHKPLGLILLSTCRDRTGIDWARRFAGRMAAASPLWFIHIAKTLVPHMRQLFGIYEAEDVALFDAMMAATSDELIAWSLRAVVDWPGVPRLDVPTLQVHGERDHVLPLKKAGPVDVVIEAAGHAVTVSHSGEVNAIVDAWLVKQRGAN